MTTYVAKVQSIIGQAFPERQILMRVIHRDEHGQPQGVVKHLVFSPLRQMFMAFALLGFTFWIIHATTLTLVPIPREQMTAIDIARDRDRMREQLISVRARQASIEAQLEERGRLLDAAEQRLRAQHFAVRYLIERAGLSDQVAYDAIERDKQLDERRDNILWFWNR